MFIVREWLSIQIQQAAWNLLAASEKVQFSTHTMFNKEHSLNTHVIECSPPYESHYKNDIEQVGDLGVN